MIAATKSVLVLAAGLAGAALPCGLCTGAVRLGTGGGAPAAAQAPDTATVKLHVSGMTCGSCPTTARLALKRLPGVYSATVTLDDSLGVVRYDPARVTPAQIAGHLMRLTGFVATVLPDGGSPRKPGAE